MTKTAPHTEFGQTREVPVHIYRDGKHLPDATTWDETYWIERGEDWYGLPRASKGINLRVVDRNEWLNSKVAPPPSGVDTP